MEVRPLVEDETDVVLAAGLGLARLDQGDGRYLVAWEGDQPVGHLYVTAADPAEIQDVSVLPAYRRRGVARALTAAAEELAAATGTRRVRLEVSVDNAAAQALYRGYGYADAGLPPRRVRGTVRIRTGPIEVDDTLLTWEKDLVPYDTELADRIRFMLGGQPVTEKKMFGGLAFLLHGNMSVAASGQGGLLVRVDPDQTEALLGEPGAEEFDMGGRGPMQGWLRVHGDVLDDDATLRAWVDRGVAYARTLPPKK